MIFRPFSAVVAALLLVSPVQAADIGDAERGVKVFAKCKACHAVGPEAKSKVGPHLNEVFGRRAAGIEGFRYSKAMRRAGADGLHWTTQQLDRYVENPKSLVSGTRMAFRGIKDAEDRRNLLAFLRQFSASPANIPESEPTATPRDPDVDPAVLAIEGDPAYGEYLSSECLTCHQASGEDKGIPSIVGWPKADFVVAMQAYKSQARPHPTMRMIAGRLSDEEIASLAVYFESLQ